MSTGYKKTLKGEWFDCRFHGNQPAKNSMVFKTLRKTMFVVRKTDLP